MTARSAYISRIRMSVAPVQWQNSRLQLISYNSYSELHGSRQPERRRSITTGNATVWCMFEPAACTVR